VVEAGSSDFKCVALSRSSSPVNNIHAGKHIATSTVCDKDGNILSEESVEFTADEDIFVKQKHVAFIPIIW